MSPARCEATAGEIADTTVVAISAETRRQRGMGEVRTTLLCVLEARYEVREGVRQTGTVAPRSRSGALLRRRR
jgi:hypothetical protein